MEILEAIAGIIIALLIFAILWAASAAFWRFYDRIIGHLTGRRRD
jgi:hypothetical protein